VIHTCASTQDKGLDVFSTLGSASEALTFFGGETHHQSDTNGDTTEKDDKLMIHNLDGVNVLLPVASCFI
jgi:hypothetical protein